MAVHTSRDWEQHSKDAASTSASKQETPNPEKGKEQGIRKFSVHLAHAPKGKANTVVRINGKPIQVQLTDGYFEITKKMNGATKLQVFEQLKRQGFTDESGWDGNPTNGRQKKELERGVPRDFEFSHPDSTKQHPIEGKIGFSVNGDPLQLEVKKGRIKTKDYDVAKELEKRGFIIQSITEKKGTGKKK